MALMKCPDCNQLVSNRASHCPNCGCPIESIQAEATSLKKSKIKQVIRFFLLFIIVALCIIAFSRLSLKLSHQGYYNQHKWGTSYESFQKMYPDDASLKSNQDSDSFLRMEHSFEEISDLDIVENYSFSDGKLYSVNVILYPSNNSDMNIRQLSKDITKKYNNFYGVADCFENGSLNTKVYKWHSPKSEITLYSSNIIMIDYKDSSHNK